MTDEIAENNAGHSEDLKVRLEEVTLELENESITLDNLKIRQNLILQSGALKKRERELQIKLHDLHRQVHSIETTRSTMPTHAFEDSTELQTKLNQMVTEAAKRERIAKELIGFISETAGMSRRDIIDELGLEINCG